MSDLRKTQNENSCRMLRSRVSQNDLAILIPSRGDADSVIEAIHLIRLYAPKSEVIVINNGDNDENTLNIILEKANVLLHCSGSVSDCRRLGAENTFRPIVLLLDADQRLTCMAITEALDLINECDAVVLSERPFNVTNWLTRLMKSERALTEYLGLAIPRMFWRTIYLELSSSAIGLRFGEDRSLVTKTTKIAYSSEPLLHVEIEDILKLFKKYKHYGSLMKNQPKTDKHILLPRHIHYTNSISSLSIQDKLRLPQICALKFGKLISLFIGVYFSS